MEIGKRIREMRQAYHLDAHNLGVNRTWLSKLENERVSLTLEMVERICRAMDVSMGRMFVSQEQFDAMLAVENEFASEVRPFLKQLSEKQRTEILLTLAAAPVSVRTRKRTSRGSKSCIEGKALTTRCRISPIPSLRLGPLPKKVEYRKLQHF